MKNIKTLAVPLLLASVVVAAIIISYSLGATKSKQHTAVASDILHARIVRSSDRFADDGLEELQDKVNDLESQIDDLKNTVDDLQSEIDGLKYKNSDLESTIDDLKNNNSYLESKVDVLGDRSDDLESRVSNLESKLRWR